MLRGVCRLLLPCLVAMSFPTAIAGESESLEKQFLDPPHEYTMVPFWSWNGTLEPERLRRQIDQMVEQGVYGAFMHARAGLDESETPYFSEGFWNAVATCIEHGEKVGFKPWLYDEDKWPSGAAGGRTMARHPDRNSQKVLRIAAKPLEGPCDVSFEGPAPRFRLAGQCVKGNGLAPDSIVDLSSLAPGAIWPCPRGKWLLLEYHFEPFGDGVNYLNRDTIRDFLDITHEEYARRFGERFGTTVPGLFFDEIMNEAGKHPGYVIWAEALEERFMAMKHYAIGPMLPALHMDLGNLTPKVRCDYYDVVTTLYEEAWFQQVSEWCKEHSLAFTGHTVEELNRYVTQGDYMRTLRHLSIPLTDNEDFRYTWPRTIGCWKPKQAASVAHLYGRPRAGAEALGGAGWCFTPDMARYGFNMLSAYGISFFVPHLFHYSQDRPVTMDDWPNSWFYENPFWKYFKTLADHVRRVSFMIGTGQAVVDVAVLYPQSNQWAGYGPGTTQSTVERLTAALIDVDVMDSPSLLKAEVRDEALNVEAMAYRVLILPGLTCMRRAEVDKVVEFIQHGGRLIVHDRWPSDSMDQGRDDDYMQKLREAAETAGVGLSSLDDTVAGLQAMGRLDVGRVSGREGALRYLHVRIQGREAYWVVNGSREPGVWRLAFRATGGMSLWQPEDGSISPGLSWADDHGTIAEISLDPWQGVFVVFDPSQLPTAAKSPEKVLATVALDGPWDFLPVGAALDESWRVGLSSAELELPVMRVRWEQSSECAPEGWTLAGIDDTTWRQVKILDSLYPDSGVNRYRTCWNARFVSINDYAEFDLERFFQPKLGGPGLRCRKAYMLPPEAVEARFAVICRSAFTVWLNGELCANGVGGDDAEVVTFAVKRPGLNTVMVVAKDAPALLVEGEFRVSHGCSIEVTTDGTWEVSLDGQKWLPAWEYLAPHEKPWGEPRHPWRAQPPTTVWYRQQLPPGVEAIRAPEIEGDWHSWVDGQPLAFSNGEALIAPRCGSSTLAIRAVLSDGKRGLLRPVTVRCVPTAQPLGSWTACHLDWYSGRAIYSRCVDVPQDLQDASKRLFLDLGKVNFCVEVWINGTLAGTRIWPPYRVEVTEHLRPGANRIDLVVANLIANRRRWDIYDDARGHLQSRKWHDDNLLRDAWCLESGLIGPVRLTGFE